VQPNDITRLNRQAVLAPLKGMQGKIVHFQDGDKSTEMKAIVRVRGGILCATAQNPGKGGNHSLQLSFFRNSKPSSIEFSDNSVKMAGEFFAIHNKRE
jgi:hypothetical protein